MQGIYEKLTALSNKALEACAKLEAYEKEIYEKIIEEEDKEYADMRLELLADFLDNAVGHYEWIKEVAEESS